MKELLVIVLAWSQLCTAMALLGMTVWLLYDAQLDWVIARRREEDNPTVYSDGLGKIRLAWLRLVESGLLCVIGVTMVWYGAASATVVGRLAVLSITWIQMLKISVDRVTRMSVLVASAEPTQALEKAMRSACEEIKDMHRDVRTIMHLLEMKGRRKIGN